VPDVVADHDATMTRWRDWADHVRQKGYKTAFVAQNGCTPSTMPTDADAIFIGGSTAWKLSSTAQRIVAHARAAGKWVHMGRVNSLRRLRIAESWGCDSVDGTLLAFAPDANTARLIEMVRQVHRQPSLDIYKKG